MRSLLDDVCYEVREMWRPFFRDIIPVVVYVLLFITLLAVPVALLWLLIGWLSSVIN